MGINLSESFYKALAQRESSGNPKVVNTLGFMGLYQMGPPALQDAGYMNSKGEWIGKGDIYSQEDFLNNSSEQTKAVRVFHDKMWGYLPSTVRGKVGETVGGIKITKGGLIGGAHLLGQGGVTQFIESNGAKDPADAYGAKI